jgi:hypothetical protein
MKFILFIIIAFMAYWAWNHGFSAGISAIPATSPLTGVRSVEQDYYVQVFDYTMTSIPAGQSYDWKSSSANGTISPGENFTSKSGYTCRKYAEIIIFAGKEQHAEGAACRRKGQDGWCRLKENEADTCALEKPSGIFGGISLGSGDVNENFKGVLGKINGFFR